MQGFVISCGTEVFFQKSRNLSRSLLTRNNFYCGVKIFFAPHSTMCIWGKNSFKIHNMHNIFYKKYLKYFFDTFESKKLARLGHEVTTWMWSKMRAQCAHNGRTICTKCAHNARIMRASFLKMFDLLCALSLCACVHSASLRKNCSKNGKKVLNF